MELSLPLTAEEYNKLYCQAFARLDEIASMAEQALQELEELQLSMCDRARPAPIVPLPSRSERRAAQSGT